MKAAVIKEPGRIEIEDVPRPSPGPGEVLLKVEACALCGTDQRVLAGEKHVDVNVVGHEITGRVADIGGGVKGVSEGDRFVVQTVIGCGSCPMCRVHRENLCEKGFDAMGYQYNGGFAEFTLMPAVAVRQGCLIPVPEDLPAENLTIIEPLSCCVNGMKYIPLEKIEHVLIFGGGIIGVLNGLTARARGAKRVTIMDVSADRLKLIASLGLPFDDLVDSREIDPESWVRDATDGRGVDAVVVAASVKPLVSLALGLMRRAGHLSVFAGMPKSDPFEPLDLNKIHYLELNLHGANSSSHAEYIEARDLITAGEIDVSRLVTHTFELDDFQKAVDVQSDPSSGALKVVVVS